MNTNPGTMTTEEMNAFIDGELDPARHAEIEAALAGDPALAGRVALLRHDKQILAELYAPLIDQPLPTRLVQAALARPTVRAAWRRPAWALAAAILLAVIFAAPRFYQTDTDRLAAEAMQIRRSAVLPEQPFADATTLQQMVDTTIGVGVRVPDLQKAGYRLDATRRTTLGSQNAVELRYRNADGKLFTVLLHHSRGADKFALLTRGALRVCIWQNDELTAVMVGEMSSSAMLRVASLTYADLNF